MIHKHCDSLLIHEALTPPHLNISSTYYVYARANMPLPRMKSIKLTVIYK